MSTPDSLTAHDRLRHAARFATGAPGTTEYTGAPRLVLSNTAGIVAATPPTDREKSL